MPAVVEADVRAAEAGVKVRAKERATSGNPFPPRHRPSRQDLRRQSRHRRPSPRPHARHLRANVDARGAASSWMMKMMGTVRWRGGRRHAGVRVRVDGGHGHDRVRGRCWLVRVVAVAVAVAVLLCCDSDGDSGRVRADACAGAARKRTGDSMRTRVRNAAAAMGGGSVLRLELERSASKLGRLGLMSAVRWVVDDRRRSWVPV
jgi:hypothetical protein